MRLFGSLVLYSFSLLLFLGCSEQEKTASTAAVPLSPYAFASHKDAVYPGQTVFVWHVKGGKTQADLDTPWVAPTGWKYVPPAGIMENQPWYSQWGVGYQVPVNVVPGTYTISHASMGIRATFTVARIPVRANADIPPGSSRDAVQKALSANKNVTLLPGLHIWDHAVQLPAGASVSGFGAKIFRKADGDYGNKVFTPLGSFWLSDATIEFDDSIGPDGLVFHNQNAVTGSCEVRRVTLLNGNLSQFYGASLSVENCTFDKSSTGQIPSNSVWRKNTFIGPNRLGRHAFFCTGALGSLVCDNKWDSTSRGIVLQTGAVQGMMAIDNRFRNIRGGEGNAGECICIEAGTGSSIPVGQGIRDNTFISVTVTDSTGPGISLFGSGMSNNIFWDIKLHVDAIGIDVSALSDFNQGPNQFMNVESTGRLNFIGKVGAQVFNNTHLLQGVPRAGQAGMYDSTYAFNRANFPIYRDAAAMKEPIAIGGECTVQMYDKVVPLNSPQK